MYYVGIDKHESQSRICVLDGSGKEVRSWTQWGPPERTAEALRELEEPFAACFEASCGTGFFYDLLKPMASRVEVAHPRKSALIWQSKRKNDRGDARKLAKMLYLGEVPRVYVPSKRVRAWRGMIEYRRRLMGRRTALKNSLRALLRERGKRPPRGLWSRSGLAWLGAVAFEMAFDAFRRDEMLSELTALEARIRRATAALNRVSLRDARVKLLMTIPGVGVRTAEAVAAYIDRAARFRSVRDAGAYAGMIPVQDQSGPVERWGHITKEGPPALRWLLVEATWQGLRRSPRLQRFYHRALKGQPARKKIAVVAAARHLLTVMVSMMKSGTPWREAVVDESAAKRLRAVV